VPWESGSSGRFKDTTSVGGRVRLLKEKPRPCESRSHLSGLPSVNVGLAPPAWQWRLGGEDVNNTSPSESTLRRPYLSVPLHPLDEAGAGKQFIPPSSQSSAPPPSFLSTPAALPTAAPRSSVTSHVAASPSLAITTPSSCCVVCVSGCLQIPFPFNHSLNGRNAIETGARCSKAEQGGR
jgi:hypothetical protein